MSTYNVRRYTSYIAIIYDCIIYSYSNYFSLYIMYDLEIYLISICYGFSKCSMRLHD